MKLNQFIDHTLLKPEATREQIKTLCEEAKQHQFFSVCVNPHYVKTAAEFLGSSHVKTCSVIGFPLGANTTEIKKAETIQAIKDGAVEIDMVINIGELINLNKNFIQNEIVEIVKICHEAGTILKVIIETSLLNEEKKLMACKAVSEARADFIKTSTGFSTGGATIEDVILLNENTSSTVKVKASGGIRTQEDAIRMIEAGASRLGVSSGVAICSGKEAKGNY